MKSIGFDNQLNWTHGPMTVKSAHEAVNNNSLIISKQASISSVTFKIFSRMNYA